MVIITIFSTGIYLYMDKTFGGDYIDTYRAGHVSHAQSANATEVADAALDQLRIGLFICTGGLLVIVPLLSYAMARRTLRPLRESYDQQEAFTDNASHELRTPLSIVQGELELALQKPRSPAAYRDAIQQSLDQTRQLVFLTNQLLLLSRGDASNVRKSFASISLKKVIDATIQSAHASRQEKARLSVSVPPKIRVYGDPALLQQAFGNILSNARKFTSETDKISVTAQPIGSMIQVVIHNSGKGMSRQEVMHAFDRFWRAERSPSTTGHGLGLPIVQQIIKLHDGTVGITSSALSGTSVTIHLQGQEKK